MIDLHTHVLPRIDDGAKSEEISKEMLSELALQGVDTIVFTPHFYPRETSAERFLQRRNGAFEKIKDSIPENVKTILGAEVHFDRTVRLEFDTLSALSLGNTRYILLEMPFEKWDDGMFQRLKKFIAETDFVPVLAHVCRYTQFHKKPILLKYLFDAGCLFQFNVNEFTDKRNRRFCLNALKHGYVHTIGSDCHDTESRPPDYLGFLRAIKKAGLEKQFAETQRISACILADEDVFARPPKKLRRFWKIWF